MSLKAAVSVRFDPAIDQRLRTLSEETGISAADLVRRATQEYLDKIESAGAITIKISREGRDRHGTSPK